MMSSRVKYLKETWNNGSLDRIIFIVEVPLRSAMIYNAVKFKGEGLEDLNIKENCDPTNYWMKLVPNYLKISIKLNNYKRMFFFFLNFVYENVGSVPRNGSFGSLRAIYLC